MEIIKVSEEDRAKLKVFHPSLDSLGDNLYFLNGMIVGKGFHDMFQEAIKKAANEALVKKLPYAKKFFDIRK